MRGRLGTAKVHIVVFAQLGNYKPGFAGPPNFILDYGRYNVYLLECAKIFGVRGRLGIAKAHIVVFAQLGN